MPILLASRSKSHMFEFSNDRFFCILFTVCIKVGSANRRCKENTLQNCGNRNSNKFLLGILLLAPVSLAVTGAGCRSPKPAEQPAPQAAQQDSGPKRYAFSGRVVSIDKPKLQVVIDGVDIPGFMMAMTMGYSVKSAQQLDPLSPEDQIKADVVVNKDDVYLENIVVVKKADNAKAAASNDAHPTTPQPDKK